MKFNLILIALVINGSSLFSQTLLTFDQALDLTLANNYDIQIAMVDQQIAENNASKANNNYLPTVSASGNYDWTYVEGENRLANETRTFEANNAYNFGASIVANYTLFNGQGRRYSYLQSKENLRFTELQLEQIIQNTILQLSEIYHEVARLEESVTNLEKSVEISKDRLVRAEYNYDYGQVNKLEVLNAKVDLNSDSVSLITGRQQLENLKRNLNFIMGREVDQDVTVSKSVEIRQNLTEEEVLLGASENNIDLKLNKSSIQINQYAIGNSKSNWLPNLNANAGYIYNGSENPNSPFVIGSQSFGPQAGLSLNWTLFNGSNNVAVKNAKLSLQSNKIQQQSIEQNIRSQSLNSFATYRNLLFILRTQNDNVATAEDNFNRTEESFKLGQINSVEFRQAQLNLLQAEQALSQAKYDAKNAELQVLAVMGALVK